MEPQPAEKKENFRLPVSPRRLLTARPACPRPFRLFILGGGFGIFASAKANKFVFALAYSYLCVRSGASRSDMPVKKKRYASLVVGNVRNFQRIARECVTVHAFAWTDWPHLLSKVISRPPTEEVAYQRHASSV